MAGERFLLQPGIAQRGAGDADDPMAGPSASLYILENVPETEHDAAVTAVCTPLVKEVG